MELMKLSEYEYRKQREEEMKKKELQAKNLDFKIRAERMESVNNIMARQGQWRDSDSLLYKELTKRHEIEFRKKLLEDLIIQKRLAERGIFHHRIEYEEKLIPQQLKII